MKYLKTCTAWLIQGLMCLLMIAFFAALLVEWAAGCGESYVDSKGDRHQNECVFFKL
jgi:hypothetical protein